MADVDGNSELKPTIAGGGAPATLNALPQGVTPILAPVIYASGVQFMRAGTDGTLIMSQARPVTVQSDTNVGLAAMNEAVAILHMSFATIKDLNLVLSGAISEYESRFGEIKTDFSEQKKAAV